MNVSCLVSTERKERDSPLERFGNGGVIIEIRQLWRRVLVVDEVSQVRFRRTLSWALWVFYGVSHLVEKVPCSLLRYHPIVAFDSRLRQVVCI